MAEPLPATALVDWLDDLSVRFLLNLPKSELSSVPRLCFQVEEAQWFYEDFVRPAVAASGAQPLPSLPLRQFCLMLFQHCPLLSGYNDDQHIAAYEEFLAYKVRVPVRGAILLDESMEKVVLVRGWKKGSSWSFPRGKINKDEKDLDCAIREVWEETGYDVRQAGLVPDDEKDAKYIDITMREQHMRLFVFRGVPEDTYFEPRTRKEISKIQWYSIRDLPGFKKQKAGGEAGGNANKFYMVAPFLGQLKKWINLQRKKDVNQPRHVRVTSDGLGIQTATEDEGETEEATPEPVAVPDRRSEDLKRLLSIGGESAAPVQLAPAQQDAQKNDLLAMLRGSAQPANGVPPPQTPFEQVSGTPKEPPALQPSHIRRLSMPRPRQPPQYPLSPPRMQQDQQRNYSMPTPQIFGPGPQFSGFPPNQQQHSFPGMLPPHMQQQQQQFQQRQSVPNMPFGQPNNISFNGPPRQQMQPPPMQQQQHPMQAPYQQHMPNAYMAQGPQGAIAAGPAVPNASQLPAPRLNAHHMNLINALTSGYQPAASPGPAAQTSSRHGSTHQAALLDLFRKPSASPAPAAEPVPAPPVEQPASPTLTDVTEKPRPPKQNRKPTLNEITRTLPLKTKVKSPPPPILAPQSRPASGQLFDPNATKTTATASTQTRQQQQPPISVLQRPSSSQGGQPTQAKSIASPAQEAPSKQKANGAAPAPFTILARPVSRGLRSPGPVAPPSPLRNQTPQNASPFQPQVLKRPKSGEGEAKIPILDASQQAQSKTEDDRKGHLLALFGKGGGSPGPSASTQSPVPKDMFALAPSPSPLHGREAPTPPRALEAAPAMEGQPNGQRNALLDLLKSPPSSQQPTPTPAPATAPAPAIAPSPSPAPTLQPPTPNPPSAPRLSPSRNPSSYSQTHSQTQQQKIHPIRQPVQPPTGHGQGQQQHQSSHSHSHSHVRSNQQNLLLDIFTRPSSSASNQHKRTNTPPINSPGTPISPFTLGTPVGAGFGLGGRERFGSIASAASVSSGAGVGAGDGKSGVVGGAGLERKGSLSTTPVEAKDREFLMGFLKGVAKGDS